MHKDKLYIKNISEDGKVGTMMLNKRIGNAYDDNGFVSEWGIDGSMFANEMRYLKEYEKCEDVVVEINSIGGDVTQDGYDIVNAIIKHDAKTKITGMAMSMAQICAVVGRKGEREIVSHGTGMFHGVSAVNPESTDGKIMGIIQDSLKTLVQEHTRMNGDEIDNLFAKGKETWVSNSKKADINLEDAVKKGIVDCIVNTGVSVKALNTLKKDSTKIYQFYNSLNTNTMLKTNEALKLSNEASDEARVDAIKAIQTENTSVKTELETVKAEKLELQNKLDAITTAEKNAKTLAAKNAVEKGKTEGKIKPEEEAEMLELAMVNLGAFEKLIAGKESSKTAKVINYGKEEGAEDLSKMTAHEYMKKNPSEFEAKMKADPNFINQFKKVTIK